MQQVQEIPNFLERLVPILNLAVTAEQVFDRDCACPSEASLSLVEVFEKSFVKGHTGIQSDVVCPNAQTG